MFVPNAMLARLVRSVVMDCSPRQAIRLRALSKFSLIGTAAFGYYARQANGTLPRRPVVSALAEDATSALVRFRFADAETLVRAMIAAAVLADRDDDHRDRIFRYLVDAGASPAEIAYAEAESHSPATPQELAQAASDPAMATEILAAALLTADGRAPAVQDFLAALGDALALPDAVFGELLTTGSDGTSELAARDAPLPASR